MGAVVADRNGRVPLKETPLPWPQLSILCVVLLTESISSTMLIPFVGYYVSFMTGRAVEEAGFSVGYLVGFFMLGQTISSKPWGAFSQKYGRKVGLVVGVLCCAIAVFFFGLSTHLYACAIWRLIHGLFGGCSLLAKSMIADITDRTNQAKGFALVSLCWGCGALLGPSLGGALYNPIDRSWLAWLHISKDGFLAHHPAFPPCFVAAVYNLFAVVICVLFLNESNKSAKPLYALLPRALARPLRPCIRFVQPKLPGADMEALYAEADEQGQTSAKDVVIIAGDDGDKEGGRNEAKEHAPEESSQHGAQHSRSAAEPKHASFGFKQAFQNPVTRTVMLISMLISTSDMMYAEVFPLWAVASRSVGGLGLSPQWVSVLVLVNCVPAIGANMLFTRVLSIFSSEVIFWNIAQAAYGSLTIAVPFSSLFEDNKAAFWFTCAMNMSRKVSECWCFAMIMLVVAQTAPPGRVSVAYGIQQATACIVRCIVPFVCAPLFAWSINGKHPFPFNHWLLFLLGGIPLMASILISGGVVIPTDDPTAQEDDGSGPEGDEEGSQVDSMKNESVRNYSFMASLHSFAGSDHQPSSTKAALLLHNSFASLANSFATNIVPGVLHVTVIPPLTTMETTTVDCGYDGALGVGQDIREEDEENEERQSRRHHHHIHHHHHHRHHGHRSLVREGDAKEADSLAAAAHTDRDSAAAPRTLSEVKKVVASEPGEGVSVRRSSSSCLSTPSSTSYSSRNRSTSSSSSYDSRDAPSQLSDSEASCGANLQEEEELPAASGDGDVSVPVPLKKRRHHFRHTLRHTLSARHYGTPQVSARQVEILEPEDERHSERSGSDEDALPLPKRKGRERW